MMTINIMLVPVEKVFKLGGIYNPRIYVFAIKKLGFRAIFSLFKMEISEVYWCT